MDQSITRTRNEIERKRQQLEVMEAIEAAMPSGLPEPKLVVVYGLWGSKASVNWMLDKVDDVVKIFDALPPTEARYQASSGTLGFKPACAVKDGDETFPVEPVTVDLDPNKRGYPQFDSGLYFDWFATIGDVPVHIKVGFSDGCVNSNWPAISTWTTGFGKNEKLHQSLFPGALNLTNYKQVRWASGGALIASSYTAYWTNEEASTESPQARKFMELLR
jgi:hypothetical protein